MENLVKKPAKSILKASSSFDQQEAQQKSSSLDIKWDEMNILQTLHPQDKDYGLMKIDEPKTPYNYHNDSESEDHPGNTSQVNPLDENEISKILLKIKNEGNPSEVTGSTDEDEEEFENLTEEEKKRRREFEIKRKFHYNEYQAVKLARKLLEEDEDEEDENENEEKDKKQDNNNDDEEDYEEDEVNRNEEENTESRPVEDIEIDDKTDL